MTESSTREELRRTTEWDDNRSMANPFLNARLVLARIPPHLAEKLNNRQAHKMLWIEKQLKRERYEQAVKVRRMGKKRKRRNAVPA